MIERNPKILHRIYFDNYAPYHDPYEHYLESWRREMPDYEIKLWNASNLDVTKNEWTREAAINNAPVFLSEFFRWQVLKEYGGVYLDADCEILDGKILSSIIDELYTQDRYDTFFGVEERSNGFPTAQTLGARLGSELVAFMADLYENRLAPFWHWREKRGLIGPQLMSLFYLRDGINANNDGFFPNLDRPLVVRSAKVYPQIYFSPKFALMGNKIDYDPSKTCVYHMFANSNVAFSRESKEARLQAKPLTFKQFQNQLANHTELPRSFSAEELETRVGTRERTKISSQGAKGVLAYSPYIPLGNGTYEVAFEIQTTAQHAFLAIVITANAGQTTLSSRKISIKGGEDGGLQAVRIPFSVGPQTRSPVEAILVAESAVDVAVSSLTIARASTEHAYKGPAPLVLHRVYFGFDGKPDVFARYLDTWKEQLPDFEIMHWNASNLDMDANEFVARCYEERDHAFLTDYFRWRILRDHGGTYLDADIEIVNGDLLRKLVLEMNISREYEAVIGIDERIGGWYTAHSMSLKPGSDLATFMCKLYDDFGVFVNWRKKGFYFWAPQLVGLYFAEKDINREGMGTTPNLMEPIVLANVKILPQDWFSPLMPSGTPDAPFKLNALTTNTVLCHHFACSWHSADSIYLAHSQEKGGQAQVLLEDIIHALPSNPTAQALKVDLISLNSTNNLDVEFVEQAYKVLLGRPADSGGLETHSTTLGFGCPRHDLIKQFLDSEEFRCRYGVKVQQSTLAWWAQVGEDA